MGNATSSAGPSSFLDQAPATANDWLVAKYTLLVVFKKPGQTKFGDPAKGLTWLPHAPSGYTTPDLKEARQIILQTAIVTFLIVSITATRCALKLWKTDLVWGLDDTTILLATIAAVIHTTIKIFLVLDGGEARHVWDVTYQSWKLVLQARVVWYWSFYACSASVKISLVLLLRNIAGKQLVIWRQITNSFLAILILYFIAATGAWIFICGNPRNALDIIWATKQAEMPKCLSFKKVDLGFSMAHITLDFLMLIPPIIILWPIRLSFWKKICVCCLFSTGVFSAVCSINRWVLLNVTPPDFQYHVGAYQKWSLADIASAIFVANLLIFQYLGAIVHRQVKKFTSLYSSSKKSSPTSTGPTAVSSATTDASTSATRTEISDTESIEPKHGFEIAHACHETIYEETDEYRSSNESFPHMRASEVRHGSQVRIIGSQKLV